MCTTSHRHLGRKQRGVIAPIVSARAVSQRLLDTRIASKTRHAAVRVSFGSLLVQRDQWDTYRGPKKEIFLFAAGGALRSMAAAPAKICQSLPKRSPWGRLGSLLDVSKRLHRTRGGFHRCIHISKVLCALLLWTMICQRFRSRALWRAPRTGACGLGDYPTLDLSQRAFASRSVSTKSK